MTTFPGMEWTVEGPAITPEMQRLFGQFAPGQVVGILALTDRIVVGYATGIQLTFSAYHSGGQVRSGLSAPTIIGGGIPSA